MKTEVVMMLKAEIVAEGGIQTVRDEATLEKYAKAINAYPKFVEALREVCKQAMEMSGQKGRYVQITREMTIDAAVLLRELGEIK